MRGYPDHAPRGPDRLEPIQESHGVADEERTVTPEEAAEADNECPWGEVEDDLPWSEYNRRMNALLNAREEEH
jgi:hypothetical protein